MHVLKRMIGPAGFLVIVPLMVCCGGCVQPITQTEIKALETRELDMPFDEAFSAAANGLFSLGFTIDHSDKVSGILTGKRLDPRAGAKLANAIFFGVIGLAATKERNEAVSFMLSPLEPNVTQLRMKVIVNGKPVVDRKMMTKIWQQIEREAMLETKPSERTPTTQESPEASADTS